MSSGLVWNQWTMGAASTLYLSMTKGVGKDAATFNTALY